MRRTGACGLLLLLAAGAARAESLSSQVNEAIRLGVDALLARQERGGRFRSEREESFPGGPTALAVYALAKSGVPAEHPAIQEALRTLRDDPPERVYSVATLVLALDALGSKEHAEWIRDLARWLVRQRAGVLWNYGPHTKGENPVDISNTQFAVLALWAAERHGYRAPGELWRELARRIPALQASSGAFVYRTGFWANGGTTTAGMTILSLALERIPRAERGRSWAEDAQEAVREGWRFLDEHFSVSENPRPGDDGDPAFHHYYYLYGLERVAALGKRDRVGGKDWYREGARYLVAQQESDGSWRTLENACFALLFLRRATFTTVHGGAPEQLPEEEQTEPLPLRAPGPHASFVRRWLVLGPFPDPEHKRLDEAIVETGAAPRLGAKDAGLAWKEARSARGWLDLEQAIGRGDHRIAYAFTYLHVRRRTDVVLSFAHDDAGKVCLDGEEIWSESKRFPVDRTGVGKELTLEPGVHRLLFKVLEHGGGSGLAVRLARRNGTPARDVVASISPDGADTAADALAHPETFSLESLLALLPVDPVPALGFDESRDVLRVAWAGVTGRRPVWQASAKDAPADRRGLVLLETPAESVGCRAIRKVAVPAGASLRVAAGCAADGECRVRIGVFDGRIHWLRDRDLAGAEWATLEAPLDEFAGREVLVLVEVTTLRTRTPVHLDEMSVVER